MSLINFSGIASGIDTNALIDATTSATRQQRVKPKQDKITELTDTDTAIEGLKKKYTKLQSIVREFSTLGGGAVAKTGTSSDETKAIASATSSAVDGTYSLTINSVAKNATFSFNDRFTSSNDAINSSINNGAPAAPNRTVAVTIGSGGTAQTVNVVIDNTTTVNQFVASFNAAASNATASAVNVGTAAFPSYAIFITTNNQGTAEGAISVSVGSEITTAGSGALASSTTDQATDAVFSISGLAGTITRSTNSVSDVIAGVTFELVAPTSGPPVNVKIGDDISATTSRVQDFVDAYNDIVKFINANNLIQQQGEGAKLTNVFSPLASTRVDDDSLFVMRDTFAATIYKSGSLVRIFPDLGITTERDGTLKFNTSVFTTAMSKEPASVNQVLRRFADATSLTGGVIDSFIRFNGTFDITEQSNKSQINELNKQISDAEALIKRQEEQLRLQFAALEKTIGKLQSQQSALTSALAGLR
jgi:flagellar hook-associated protein 2